MTKCDNEKNILRKLKKKYFKKIKITKNNILSKQN